jgi:CysZ protein
VRVIRDFFSGIGIFARGFRTYVTSPGLMWLGVLPALIVGLLFGAALVAVIVNLDGIVTVITPFARGWELEPLVRIVAGLAVLALTVLLIVYTYTAATLAAGSLFYERIWRAVETSLGNPPAERNESAWVEIRRGLANGVTLLMVTVLVSLMLFVLGFIPIVGALLVPVLGALFGGWFLSLELTGFAFDARGIRLRDRRWLLGRRRARTLGFGVACYLAFLVPLGAVIAMPAAVAGATRLARMTLDEHQPA